MSDKELSKQAKSEKMIQFSEAEEATILIAPTSNDERFTDKRRAVQRQNLVFFLQDTLKTAFSV